MEARAIWLVRSSFKSVTAVPDGQDKLVASFYATLFTRSPETRDFFPAGMTLQRDRLFNAIAHVLDLLEQPEKAFPFLAQLGRDHRKYGVKEHHYEALGSALIDALSQFVGTEMWTEEVDFAWRQAIAIINSTMLGAASQEAGPATWAATVVDHRRVRDDLAVIRLQLDRPLPYDAGQYVSVQIPQRPRMWRYLSPAIPSNPDGQIEFHVRRVSGGWVSPAIIRETIPGDRWLVGAPLGGMNIDRTRRQDVLMIASGTGIAPLRAQIMEMTRYGENPRIHLFVGGRYPCDLYDIDTLWRLSLTNPWLTVVPVSEFDTNPWWHRGPPTQLPAGMHQLRKGTLDEVVASYGNWSDRLVQIVGSPAMIRITKYKLMAGGTPTELIQHDPLL